MSPDGHTHIRIWKSFFPLFFIVIIFVAVFYNWYFALWMMIGYFLHWGGLEPDLDLISISRSESIWIKTVILIPLVVMSTFYARCLQKWGGHRGFGSHSPFISSAIRLLFFSYPFVLIFRHYFPETPLYFEFFAMWLSLSFADCLHIGADYITGELNFWGRAGAKSRFLNFLMEKIYDFPSDEVLRKRKNRLGHRGHYYEDKNY